MLGWHLEKDTMLGWRHGKGSIPYWAEALEKDTMLGWRLGEGHYAGLSRFGKDILLSRRLGKGHHAELAP